MIDSLIGGDFYIQIWNILQNILLRKNKNKQQQQKQQQQQQKRS